MAARTSADAHCSVGRPRGLAVGLDKRVGLGGDGPSTGARPHLSLGLGPRRRRRQPPSGDARERVGDQPPLVGADLERLIASQSPSFACRPSRAALVRCFPSHAPSVPLHARIAITLSLPTCCHAHSRLRLPVSRICSSFCTPFAKTVKLIRVRLQVSRTSGECTAMEHDEAQIGQSQSSVSTGEEAGEADLLMSTAAVRQTGHATFEPQSQVSTQSLRRQSRRTSSERTRGRHVDS